MDICLNISSAPAAKQSKKLIQNAKASFTPFVKKQLKKSTRNNTKTPTGAKQPNNAKNVSGAPKTRVKQKSLMAIVARKQNESANRRVPSTAAPASLYEKKDNESTFPVKSILKTPKTTNVNEKKVTQASKSSNSSSTARNQISDSPKPTVTFVKPSQEKSLKTILAKRRVKTDDERKKARPSIFGSPSNADTSESRLLERTSTSVSLEKKTTNVADKANRSNQRVQTPNATKTDYAVVQRNENKGRDHHEFKNKSGNSGTASGNKPSRGTISSLFGNNPEIVSMGQRFVKVVDEAVFSGTKFSDFGLHPYSVSNLEQNMEITKLTTIQQKAIPEIMSGKDVLVRSQTGSGKTLAYALPIVEALHKVRPKFTRNSGLRALVVVPTRELALQTYECFLKLTKPFQWIVAGYLVGGEKRKAEKARLRRGCTILVATPGRLLDHIKHTEALRLNLVKCFVLDEADRMLDLGYEKDISEIVSALTQQANLIGFGSKQMSQTSDDNSGYDPLKMLRREVVNPEVDSTKPETVTPVENQESLNATASDQDDNENANEISEENDKNSENSLANRSRRQTVLLSATLTQAVEKLAGLTMENPVFVDAAQENSERSGGSASAINEDLIVPQSVAQSYIITPPKLRLVTLSAYIIGKYQSAGQHKMLIFMATQDMVDYHVDILSSVLCSSFDKDEDDEDDDFHQLSDVEFFKLHGNMTQKERTEVFKTFRQAQSGILFCTDVAARGLNLPKVDSVVQYTGPISARDYVHRVGRTARAGSSGSAVIFITPPEVGFIRMLESRRIRIQQEDMDGVLDKLLGPLSRTHNVQTAATALQNRFETLVLEDKKIHEKAGKAYVSWIRFYATYPKDMREIFDRRELHLGHYAKAFGLRDQPRRIGTGIGKTMENQQKKVYNNRLTNERPKKIFRKNDSSTVGGKTASALKRVRMLNTSEYGSGLEPSKKRRKT